MTTDRRLNIILDHIAMAASLMSVFLLVAAPEGTMRSLMLMALSIVMIANPKTFMPVILVSSMSTSIAVGPLAAIFYYMALYLVSMLMKSSIRFYVPKQKHVVMTVVFALWILLCGIMSTSGEIYDTVKLLVLVALLLMCTYTGKPDYKEHMRAFLAAAPVFAAAGVAKIIFAPETFVIEGSYIDIYLKSISGVINPNQISAVAAVFAFIGFIYMLNRKSLYGAAAFLLPMVFIFLLKSRTSFYASLAICLAYFVISYNTRRIWKYLALAAIIAGIGLQFLRDPEPYMGSGEEKELTVTSMIEDSGSGRFFNWAEAFNTIIPEHPVFGIGMGRENYEALGFDFDSDNLYVDLLAELGIPGLILFIIFISILFATVASGEMKDRTMIYILAMMLVIGLGETVFDSYLFWVVVAMAMVYIRSMGQAVSVKKEEKKPERKKRKAVHIIRARFWLDG